ncbi:hypothetical protein AOQ84DRAFT_130661 [Glonium stellatum]|uniref:Uncharacterized protein n=1 Tax=Glonium stellatum TaxID=574774 RepID=A0A8E2ESC4_9PEZI|nr:hypothetical protein AOQ84DRAFT_130661 [Glonium stellatum]
MHRSSQHQACTLGSKTFGSTVVNHPTSVHTEPLACYMEFNTTVTYDQQSTNSNGQDYDHIGAQFSGLLQDEHCAIGNALYHPHDTTAARKGHCNCPARDSPLQSKSNGCFTMKNLVTHERLVAHDPAGKFDESIKGALAAAKCLQFAELVDTIVSLGELGKLPLARWAESQEGPFSKTVSPRA